MDFSELFRNFPELTTTGLTQGAIYALVALGYTLVYGVLRLINFAHSEVFMVGTFAAMWTWNALGFNQNLSPSGVLISAGVLIAGLLAAVAVSSATAVAVELTAYRPLRKRNAPPLAFLISAIGASFVIMEIIGIATDRAPYGNMPELVSNKPLFTILGAEITPVQIVIVVGALVMLVGLDWFINNTRLGRGVRAVAQDPDSAALMGVNKGRVIGLVFLLGGVMAGVAAVFANLKYGFTKFNLGFLFGLKAFTAAVLGGIGNLRGAVLGGLLLGLVENYASALVGTQFRDLVAFVVLIAVLMFRPTGILGESLGRARA
ncbi:branched-chain amino acid ABC transporter permease [Catellatospora bangladeshensis]|uniref:Branched-chain amino acid ABC transporter permease n=1 Tax=Catellatospora bangladeshensis TaxID=310355 RepID=A0A8J3JEM5_9ACTN|nr:branched-chain amino acid ABC transporter permease [Catellatospora bangladeshensis]GIF79132.1 branched-chain amino acid ABC transporter permease [Catellatospora bangladeshensis]